MELVCVRHGRTAWNAVRRFQGRTDVPLDHEGRAQALALGAHLRRERFDFAVASDLSRAMATAAEIAATTGITIEPEPRLREMGFGEWEGLTWDEIVERWPEVADQNPASTALHVPKGGETFDDVSLRITPVLHEIAARLDAHGRALMVCHAGIMHALLRVALAEPNEAALGITFAPASIMRLSGDGTIPWRLDVVNEIAPPLTDSTLTAP